MAGQDTKWGKSEGCFTGVFQKWTQPALLGSPPEKQVTGNGWPLPSGLCQEAPGVTGSPLETWSQPQGHLPLPGALRVYRLSRVSPEGWTLRCSLAGTWTAPAIGHRLGLGMAPTRGCVPELGSHKIQVDAYSPSWGELRSP